MKLIILKSGCDSYTHVILTISSLSNLMVSGSPDSLISSKTCLKNGVWARHCKTEL